jgi:tetratricopeptide (TPR) repeat protein
MGRSVAQPLALAALALVAVGASVPRSARAQDASALVERSERLVDEHRYDEAQEALEAAVQSSDGDLRQEAQFRLAGLKRSADDAQALYRKIIDEDPKGDWAKRSRLELAKLQYALGNYGDAYELLSEGDVCGVTDEACLFRGLSALLLKRYNDAREPLSRVRQGRLRAWAAVSLAEADMGLNRKDEACRRYESLSSALIIPTALYRFGECLEDRGDVDGAKREYREIIRSFRDTPEAVLAAEKLQAIENRVERSEAPPPAPAEEHAGTEVLESGFTLQFGSFRDRGNAIKLAAKIKRVYPGVRIDSDLVHFREHYRVRYGYFRTREEARAMGEEIARQTNEDYTIMILP